MRRLLAIPSVGLAIAVLLAAFAAPASATPGQLDHFFNNTGKNTALIAGGTGYAVAIDHIGRVLVAGYTLSSATDIALARFLPDGKPDPSFGTGGRVITNLGGTDYAFDVAIQRNGSIVVAGERDLPNSSMFAVVRYGIHGVLDKSFGGGDGKVLIDFGRRYQGANAVAVGDSGKIVVGGFASNGTASQWALARLNPNGTFDGGFGHGGKVLTDLSPTNEQLEDLRIGTGASSPPPGSRSSTWCRSSRWCSTGSTGRWTPRSAMAARTSST